MKKKIWSLLILAFPYLVTVFLPVLSILFLGRIVQNNYQEKLIADNQRDIEASFERFLKKIDTVEKLSYSLANSDAMKRYSRFGMEGHAISESFNIKDILSGFMIDDNVVAIYFYDVRDNRIITNDAFYSDAKDYFLHRYKKGEKTPEEYVEELKLLPWERTYSTSQLVTIDNLTMQIIEYRMSVPVTISKKPKGQMVMILDTVKLFSDFSAVLGEESEFYVYDVNDTLIYGRGAQYEELLLTSEVGGLKKIASSDESLYGMVCNSQNGYWKLKVFIPDMLKGLNDTTTSVYMGILVLLPIVACTILCIYFTLKNHREICGILNLFKGHSENSLLEETEIDSNVGYRHIREYIDKMMRENSHFKERMVSYEQSHKYEILDKLIRNTYKKREEFLYDLEKTRLDIADGKCVAICIRYKGSDYRTMVTENVTIKDFVQELLKQFIERSFEIFDTSARETICILSIDEEEDVAVLVQEIISSMSVEIAYNYGIELEICAGDVVDSLLHISNSYEQAKLVLGYNETNGSNLYLYSELKKRDDVYYYPFEFEQKIYNYVVTGKVTEAKEIIGKIYKENFRNNERMVSERSEELIRKRLSDSIILIAEKYDISTEGMKIVVDMECDIKSYFTVILKELEKITELICDKKKTVQNQSACKLLNYVKENYCNSELSLKQISFELGYNEHYVSDLFKNVYGERLSVFIEKLRIEKACEMMNDENIKIREVSQRVGYVSDVSFRRAFKKVMGISPSEYKNIS